MTNKWSFPVSKKMLASCHGMGLVRMQKQWLVVHNCTRLGYHFSSSHFSSHSWDLTGLSCSQYQSSHSFKTEAFPLNLPDQPASHRNANENHLFLWQSKYRFQTHPFHFLLGTQAIRAYGQSRNWTHGAERAGAGAPELCLLRWQWTHGAAE